MTLFATLAGFVLGAAAGSFVAASLWRFSKGLHLDGLSFCPHCGEEIPPKYNIPIVSFLWLRGKGKCCGQPIPRKDFLIEVAGALLGALLGFLAGAIAPAIAVAALIVVFWIADKRLG